MNPNNKDLLFDLAGLMQRMTRVRIPKVWQGELLVLAYLERVPARSLLPVEIKKALDLTSARVSAILNGLEKKGFIVRTVVPGDRRKVLVEITENGIRHYEQQLEEAVNLMEPISARMGREDMNTFFRLLHKLTSVLYEVDDEEKKGRR